MEPEFITLFASALCADAKRELELEPTPAAQKAAEALRQLTARAVFRRHGLCSVFPPRVRIRRPGFELTAADRETFLFFAGFAAVTGGDVRLKMPDFALSAVDCAALTAS